MVFIANYQAVCQWSNYDDTVYLQNHDSEWVRVDPSTKQDTLIYDQASLQKFNTAKLH